MHATASQNPNRATRWWREWIRPYGLVALVVFSLRSAVADWNGVPTGSMRPTILEGERILVNRLAYDLKIPFTTRHLAEWGAPERGDVVVFYSPMDGQRLVKRVIGLPGDVVELQENRLLLNGGPVEYQSLSAESLVAVSDADRPDRRFAKELLPGRSHPVMAMTDRPARRTYGPVTVPAGRYFVMGDNRDNSFDSRFFGTVPRESILGRATAVVTSVDPDRWYAPRWDRWFHGLP